MGRKYKKSQEDEFIAYFTLDFIDLMGAKRKISLFEEFCDVTDFPKKQRDPLAQITGEENLWAQKNNPLNRAVPFDIDDEIIVLPNFVTRKVNSLLVIPANMMLRVMELTLLSY